MTQIMYKVIKEQYAFDVESKMNEAAKDGFFYLSQTYSDGWMVVVMQKIVKA